MGKTRRRRTYSRSPSGANQKGKSSHKQASLEKAKEKPTHRRYLLELWKNSWAILGPIVALIGLFFLLKPVVEVESSANLDPSQPLATQFRIRNHGHVPVYDVHFGCGIGKGSGYSGIGYLLLDDSTLKPIPKFRAGASVTRSCALESTDIVVPNNIITITVIYTWPLIHNTETDLAYFKIVHGAPGYFLVPDLP